MSFLISAASHATFDEEQLVEQFVQGLVDAHQNLKFTNVVQMVEGAPGEILESLTDREHCGAA